MTGTIGKPHCSPLLSLPCFLFLPLSLFLHLFLLCVFFFDHIEKKKKKVRQALGDALFARVRQKV